jgi:hypothetical protein
MSQFRDRTLDRQKKATRDGVLYLKLLFNFVVISP